eukprot:11537467-Alexandrium_andersonii.AAC.1
MVTITAVAKKRGGAKGACGASGHAREKATRKRGGNRRHGGEQEAQREPRARTPEGISTRGARTE